jgi:uncharacterized protein (DUF58 family)
MNSPAKQIDWSALRRLKIRARALADGTYVGNHRSARRGAGIEFAGFREYTLGDDLRFLDRRAMLRYDKLLIRQFESETDRDIWILLDNSPSMRYRGSRSACRKLDYAVELALALVLLAVRNGDVVSLRTASPSSSFRRAGGMSAFERASLLLQDASTSLETTHTGANSSNPAVLDLQAIRTIGEQARRGAVIFVLSDFLDVIPRFGETLAQLGSNARSVRALQVLDQDEVDFPFKGSSRFVSLESSFRVEADESVRDTYLARLASAQAELSKQLERGGGTFVTTSTKDDATKRLRELLG